MGRKDHRKKKKIFPGLVYFLFQPKCSIFLLHRQDISLHLKMNDTIMKRSKNKERETERERAMEKEKGR